MSILDQWSAGRERRLHKRYPYRMEIILLNNTQSYRSETLNISQSGAFIETHVPEDFMNCTVEIVLVFSPTSRSKLNPKKEMLRFRGLMITANRLTFMSDFQDASAKLKGLLSEFRTA